MKTALVIGGGFVGFSTALQLAEIVDQVFLAEKEQFFGMHGSSRSSEISHAGIYYPPGSLKAQDCVEGNKQLHEFCPLHKIPYQRVEKLIVARNEHEITNLAFLLERSVQNNVPGVRLIDVEELKAMEPNVRGVAALYVPTSGVLDSSAYLECLKSLAEDKGVLARARHEVVAVDRENDQFAVTFSVDGVVQESMCFDLLVNAAGVHADKVAQMINPENTWEIYPIKGETMVFHPNRPKLQTSRHIYQAPVTYLLPDGSRGQTTAVHTSLKLDGTVTLGPLYHKKPPEHDHDYKSTRTAENFLERFVGILPELKASDLKEHLTGIQPKLKGGDFVAEPDKRYPNAYHYVGIDTPGLTASIPLGERARAYFQ